MTRLADHDEIEPPLAEEVIDRVRLPKCTLTLC